MRVIDVHTHAFPDAVAEKAIPFLENEADVKAYTDGTIGSLLASMDRAGIETSVVCSIATKVSQFGPILEWSKTIASPSIVPLASIHPEDPDMSARAAEVKAAGLKGVKLHPYYQNFIFNDPRMFPLYRALIEHDLILLCHTGFDIAYPRDRIVDPEKIAAVMERFPHLRLITSHTGAWEDWDEVRKHLLGKEVFMETSYTLGILPDNDVVSILQTHPSDYLLFGTDCPWDDQKRALDHFLSLPIEDEIKEKMLFTNAKRLLGL
ncbi:MAG: amidohydrolase family protein [Spirochaetales bacterium]|nr:amidohydrolase family protein [Spirochaetales bacterium]